MLNQEKECSNLELSKKLKELGVLQESKFYWFKNYFPDGYLKKGEWELVSGKPLFQKDETVVCDNDCYSAYTIGELLEMLPSFTSISGVQGNGKDFYKKYWFYIYKTISGKYIEYATSYILNLNDVNSFKHFKNTNLANALSEMLIYLIENNYITVEEINNKN